MGWTSSGDFADPFSLRDLADLFSSGDLDDPPSPGGLADFFSSGDLDDFFSSGDLYGPPSPGDPADLFSSGDLYGPPSPGDPADLFSSRYLADLFSSGSQSIYEFPTQTIDPTTRPSRQRARNPDKRLPTSSHTIAGYRDHQDRNTWSVGSTPAIVQRTSSTSQRSLLTTVRTKTRTDLQLHRPPLSSSTTPTNTQRTPSNPPTWGQHGCISCRRAPTNGVTVFCKPCHGKVLRMAPMIVEVPKDHERYKSGQWIKEKCQKCSTKQLTYVFSCIAVPGEMDARRPMS